MYDRRVRSRLASALGDAFLAGVWNEGRLLARGAQAISPRPRWLLPLTREVLGAYQRPPSDRPRELAAFIAVKLDDGPWVEQYPPPRVRRQFIPKLEMARTPWPVPRIASVEALADYLEVTPPQLAWLADVRGLERRVGDLRLRHYGYAWLPRPSGVPRVIESPKQRLKAIQRRLLHDVLNRIPAHDAAHGFTRGRSARSHAARHTGQGVVLGVDLEDFFAAVWAGRVYGIFRTAGYPEPVAHALTALTTNVVPRTEWASVPQPLAPHAIYAYSRLGRRLATPHLPQGAPTSPALANLAAFALDRRLAGLAETLDATYTRYADDLTFSGSGLLADHAGELRALIVSIARDEGFGVNTRKHFQATRAHRQRVCGIVVNERTNVDRREYDELKAILHNAARNGPADENRAGVANFRAHLLGRVAWVEALNPQRGSKLRERFERIAWTE